jgi:hypothetical protein
MAKFCGIIVYAISTETAPGVWTDEVIERKYTGDVVTNLRRWQPKDQVNPDLAVSDTISIVADGFALANRYAMKYVKWQGAKLAIASVKIEHPRVVLELGGLYSGQAATTAPEVP